MEKLINDQPDALHQIDLQSLIDYMVENIGNIDPSIRDSLIYSGFCRLILDEKVIIEQTESILTTCIDNQHLYLDIQQKEKSDAVFVRSFSALVIALILFKDAENRALPQALVAEAIGKSSNYLNLETDYRGYVEEKGWAHAVAHGSDLLAQAISHPLFDEIGSIDRCLLTIKKCLITEYAYIDDEDERILAVIDALLTKGLTDEQLKAWLTSLHDFEEKDVLKNLRKQWNTKKFTLTLYAHLLRKNQCKETSNWIFSSVS